MQKVSDKPLAKHVKCGGKMEKEWSRTGFQFKGSGWYVTDYAAKKSETTDAKETSSETNATAASSSTPDAAAKSDDSKSKRVGSKKSTKSDASTSTKSGD
jgi:predicted nucleic acid-binding Zn ribbon protein